MGPELIRVIIVIAVVAIVELAKKFIFKDQEKYKLIYTVAPIVLCALAYLVLALIQKTDVWTAIVTGGTLGFTCMGSYDIIAAIIKQWKDKSPREIAKEVEDVIGKKEVTKK